MFRLYNVINGDDIHDAESLDAIAAEIQEVMSDRPGTKRLMKYRVEKRDKRDKDRFEHFFRYEGPDSNTKSMLIECFERWNSTPASFWGWEVDAAFPVGDPQAYAVGSFMLSDHDGC